MALQAEKIIASKDSKANRSFFSKKNESRPLIFQTKLNAGAADDVYECEAVAVADKIMHSEDQGQTKISSLIIQPKCAACEEEEKLQRKENDERDELSETQILVAEALGSSGNPLDDNTSSFMENRFGCDFSKKIPGSHWITFYN